jgi:hypothetical protein
MGTRETNCQPPTALCERDRFILVSDPKAHEVWHTAAETQHAKIVEIQGQSDRRQSQWWFVGTALAVSALGLLSTRLGSVDIAPDTASDLRGLVGALSAVSIMALGLQLVLVSVLVDRAGQWDVFRPPSPVSVVVTAVIAGGLSAAGAVLFIDSSAAFEIRAAITIGLAVGSLVASIPSRSVLLGEERWRELALVGIVSSASRLVFTVATHGSDPVVAVLGGLVIGEIVGAALALRVARHARRVDKWPDGMRRTLTIGTLASGGLMLTIVLSSLSVGRFMGEDVQLFNQSAAVARLVFILTFTVAFVFFPTMARLPIGSVLLRRRFHSGLLLASVTAAVASCAIIAFPEWFLSVVNADADEPTTTVRILAVAFALYGIAGVSLMQYIAHGSRVALLTVSFVPVLAIGHVVTSSAIALSWLVLGSAVALLAVATIPALVRVQPVLRPTTVWHPVDTSAAVDAVTVVIPSYNPGPIIVETIQATFQSFDDAGIDVRVIVVSDGSTDGSQALIDKWPSERLRHIELPCNQGKGAALRTGLAAAATPVVGFVDADGDLAPSQLVEMSRVRQELNADIVFGSKRHSESLVFVPAHRALISRTYEMLTRHMFQLDIVDTQTGIKVFSRPVLTASLPLLEETGFALDLELFVAARANGYHNFIEFPVTMTRQGGSTVSARSILRTTVEILHVFWRAKVTLHYLRAALDGANAGASDQETTSPSAPTITSRPQP